MFIRLSPLNILSTWSLYQHNGYHTMSYNYYLEELQYNSELLKSRCYHNEYRRRMCVNVDPNVRHP